jgi:hypothetical protein
MKQGCWTCNDIRLAGYLSSYLFFRKDENNPGTFIAFIYLLYLVHRFKSCSLKIYLNLNKVCSSKTHGFLHLYHQAGGVKFPKTLEISFKTGSYNPNIQKLFSCKNCRDVHNLTPYHTLPALHKLS